MITLTFHRPLVTLLLLRQLPHQPIVVRLHNPLLLSARQNGFLLVQDPLPKSLHHLLHIRINLKHDIANKETIAIIVNDNLVFILPVLEEELHCIDSHVLTISVSVFIRLGDLVQLDIGRVGSEVFELAREESPPFFPVEIHIGSDWPRWRSGGRGTWGRGGVRSDDIGGAFDNGFSLLGLPICRLILPELSLLPLSLVGIFLLKELFVLGFQPCWSMIVVVVPKPWLVQVDTDTIISVFIVIDGSTRMADNEMDIVDYIWLSIVRVFY